jgi:hypothetical protein
MAAKAAAPGAVASELMMGALWRSDASSQLLRFSVEQDLAAGIPIGELLTGHR